MSILAGKEGMERTVSHDEEGKNLLTVRALHCTLYSSLSQQRRHSYPLHGKDSWVEAPSQCTVYIYTLSTEIPIVPVSVLRKQSRASFVIKSLLPSVLHRSLLVISTTQSPLHVVSTKLICSHSSYRSKHF